MKFLWSLQPNLTSLRCKSPHWSHEYFLLIIETQRIYNLFTTQQDDNTRPGCLDWITHNWWVDFMSRPIPQTQMTYEAQGCKEKSRSIWCHRLRRPCYWKLQSPSQSLAAAQHTDLNQRRKSLKYTSKNANPTSSPFPSSFLLKPGTPLNLIGE